MVPWNERVHETVKLCKPKSSVRGKGELEEEVGEKGEEVEMV